MATGDIVEVSRALRAPPGEVWQALTNPDKLPLWFGTLSSPFRQGRVTTLNFGDGDFYALEVLGLEPLRHLAYVRRNHGIGPKSYLHWRIQPLEGGSLVSLTDREPQRSREAGVSIRQYWLRVTRRLEAFLESGGKLERTEPGGIHVASEFPGARKSIFFRLIDPESRAGWFPCDGALTKAGECVDILDGREPKSLHVENVRIDERKHTLGLTLRADDWLHSTECVIRLSRRGQDTRVAVEHVGWESISFEIRTRREQRERFAVFWQRAMMRLTASSIRELGIPAITPTELHARMGRPDLFVVDANRSTLWARGHIPGAIHVGQEEIPAQLLPPEKDSTLVFYCRDSL